MSETPKDASLEQCLELSCKRKAERFKFCAEHFEHFKFGTIKKNGLRPLDYEKKLEHFNRRSK